MSKARTLSDKATAGRKNYIINGDMRVAQRGTSFGLLGADAYTLDRWLVQSNVTVSQVSLLVDEITEEPSLTKALSLAATTTGKYLVYRVEDVTNFSNQTLTLSFYAKGTTSGTIQNIYARQYFGTGGSAVVDTAFGSLTHSINSASYSKYSESVTLPSISGKTIGTGSYLEIFMEIPSSMTTLITGVQLEKGSVATDFEQRPIGEELALCQRYYFRWTTATAVTAVSALQCYNTTSAFGVLYTLPVVMRTTPTVAVSNITHFSLTTANAVSVACTAGSLTATNANTIYTPFVTASSVVAGNVTKFRSNTTSAWFDAGAEL